MGKQTQGKGAKILTLKQTLNQIFPIALAQTKTGNGSENLLNEIWQIMCFLYGGKEITKKVYNNIMNPIKVQYKIDTIFTDNNKTSNPQRLLISSS